MEVERRALTFRESPRGAFVGRTDEGEDVYAEHESATLVIGPPRTHKTSAIVIPTILRAGHVAVVSTSVKNDVMNATLTRRGEFGRTWVFDPAGSQTLPAGAERLLWSPVAAASVWDRALMVARAMSNIHPMGLSGSDDESHWASRRRALLAPLLHAAALDGRSIFDVLRWVVRHDTSEAVEVLENTDAARALDLLEGIDRTAPRERAAIFSTAADVLEVYSGEGAARAAGGSNFDARAFVASSDSVYVCAAPHEQELAAPLVVGLLTEIRYACYEAARASDRPRPRLTMVLDEVANIAPLHDLAVLISTAGGQGVHVVCCFQDLSQARARWGPDIGDGLLSLFGTKVVLGGVMDGATLSALSQASGERTSWNDSLQIADGAAGRQETRGMVADTRPNLTPGDLSAIPSGHALCVRGVRWDLAKLVPHWSA